MQMIKVIQVEEDQYDPVTTFSRIKLDFKYAQRRSPQVEGCWEGFPSKPIVEFNSDSFLSPWKHLLTSKCGGEISCQLLDLVRKTAMKLILVVAVQNLFDFFGLHKGSSCAADPKIKWRI